MRVIHYMKESNSKVEVELTDWRGTPVEKGSKIVYATAVSSSIDITEAEVVDVIPVNSSRYIDAAERLDAKMVKEGYDEELEKKMKGYLALAYKLRVVRTNKPGGFSSWEQKDKILTIRSVERIVVLP